jgi:phosphomannomutase
MDARDDSLRAHLTYEPQAVKFGTSGRRGEVIHLTQLEIYINALAELEYLQSLPTAEGGIFAGEEFHLAYDLRPSSTCFDPALGNRGELAQALLQAIRDAGLEPVNLGRIPTPALTLYSLRRNKGSMMVTGSHIPFDRNGYKTNTGKGELRKEDEAPINQYVEAVRQRLYKQPYSASLFDEHGRFKIGHKELPPENSSGCAEYVRRYLDFFADQDLAGMRLLVYQHSAVGRDLMVEVLQGLGAEVVAAGRSETFVPIDTENVDETQLGSIQALVDQAWAKQGFDAVVSTDGDSDRPLVLGFEPTSSGAKAAGRVRFFGGDALGMIVAEFLGADAVVAPISCIDSLERGALKDRVEPRTCIGSPFVIAGMKRARDKGRRAICGFEANGGFLTASEFRKNGRALGALPTRDALLPILGTLASAREKGMALSALFDALPRRFGRAALLKKIPRALGLRIVERFSPGDTRIKEIAFKGDQVRLWDEHGQEMSFTKTQTRAMLDTREALGAFFTPALGFGRLTRINSLDGLRLWFSNGDIAHVRPSGNADELRIYAVADTQARADAIARFSIAEPDGILRRLIDAADLVPL